MHRAIVLLLFSQLLPFAVSDEKDVKGEDGPTVHLQEGTWQDVQKFVSQQKGKVVVLDLWSTSCLPCMKEFPHLVKLHQQHGSEVVCVSMNLDYAGIKSKPPAYYRPRVEKFLKSRKADFRNYLSTVEAVEVFDAVSIASIPAVFVYDRTGKLAKKFDESLFVDGNDEAFTYESDILPFVATLLK